MPLNKPSGNMYPWAYTWNLLAGKCPYACGYCYVGGKIAPWMKRMGNSKYYGPLRLIESELKVPLVVPKGYVIFVQSCGDLFAEAVLSEWIQRVLDRIKEFPQTTFLLQTKNPERFFEFEIPKNCILGTTIESNRPYLNTKAPHVTHRFLRMKELGHSRKTMLSIEPIMDFDWELALEIEILRPTFISVGADSGENNLPEPSAMKLKNFLEHIERITEVRRKKNLSRLLNNSFGEE